MKWKKQMLALAICSVLLVVMTSGMANERAETVDTNLDATGCISSQKISDQSTFEYPKNVIIKGSTIIMFDGSHGNDPYNDFPDWIDDLQANGYSVTVNAEPLSLEVLQQADVLVVPGAAANFHISSPYTASEADIIAQFVESGGGLFLTGDHTTYSNDVQEVANVFSVSLNADSGNEGVFTTFDTSHPIMQNIVSVEYYAYTTISPGPSSPLIWETDNDPVAVTLEYGDGRVAIFGDYNFVDTPYANGYNTLDNAKLAMQTVDWLYPCALEYAVHQADVPNPDGILNPLRELRDDDLKDECVDRYYGYSPELKMVMTRDPALAHEAARLLVKNSPMVKHKVNGIGVDEQITERNVKEIVSFTDRLERSVLKNRGEIGATRSQEIIKFLDEFKEQVEASEGKTFSEALQDSIYYMGNIDTTPDENNESGIASIDTTVNVPEASSSSGITRP